MPTPSSCSSGLRSHKAETSLLTRVLEAAGSFFPALLYPKVYQTARAERVWGGPLPLSDWRSTLGRVIDFGMHADHWRRRPRDGARHV